MDFGAKLKQLRGTRSQTEVAEAMGFKQSTYAMYENGKREPGFSNLCRIADYFGVSVDYLLGRTDYKGFDGDIRNACDLLGISQTTAEQLALLKEQEPEVLSVVDDFIGDIERVFALCACLENISVSKSWSDYLSSKSNEELVAEFQQPDSVGIFRVNLNLGTALRDGEYQIRDILSEWAKEITWKYSRQPASAPVDLERLKHEIDLQRLIAEANKHFKVTFKRGSPPPLSETETQIVIRPDEEVPTAEQVMQILEDRINGETQSS